MGCKVHRAIIQHRTVQKLWPHSECISTPHIHLEQKPAEMHAISLSETKCFFLCVHTHLYRQTQTHTLKEGRHSSLGSYEEATYMKKQVTQTSLIIWHLKIACICSLHHPKPNTDSSLPQYVSVKMERSISRCKHFIFQKYIFLLFQKWPPQVLPNLHDLLLWNTMKIFLEMFYDLNNCMN